ncbi:uncharacterized protein EV420DRAFT_1748659 [Desarmillaria tabescens]|uniref:Uncharacterized protein n=1 Tax=Armillaria tabescens TaxID=1929756 RepID=A0AA39KAP3_ARMTA|nr:uncharacterized protein EV420DRAFT_1748659 [Desarmillaria tabescens]KAK0457512.1 hypothetical protein EV420DRAFT_1748659 [Desarmillaria tabescens]
MTTSLISLNEHTPKSKEPERDIKIPRNTGRAAKGPRSYVTLFRMFPINSVTQRSRYICGLTKVLGTLHKASGYRDLSRSGIQLSLQSRRMLYILALVLFASQFWRLFTTPGTLNPSRHQDMKSRRFVGRLMLNREAWRLPSRGYFRNTSDAFTDDVKSQRSDGRPRTITRVDFSLRSRTLLNGTSFSVVISLDYGAWGLICLPLRVLVDAFETFPTASSGQPDRRSACNKRQLERTDYQLGRPDSMDLSQSIAGIKIMPA